jgi:RNA polymerase sigma factor (sigma-70 family)
LRLVRHRARVRRRTVGAWLVQVAAREALRLLDHGGRDLPLDELEGAESRTPDLIEEFTECRNRLREIESLPERQRRLLWLQGLGFSYEEMARATGESHRTIQRQLARARDQLAEA